MQDCVYQTPVQDVTDLKQRLTDAWNGLLQSIVDDAVDEWRKRPCVKDKGRHFEHLLKQLNLNSLDCAVKLVVF